MTTIEIPYLDIKLERHELLLLIIVAYLTPKLLFRNRDLPKRTWKRVPGSRPIVGHLPLTGGPKTMFLTVEKWCDEYGKETGCVEFNLAKKRIVAVCREDRLDEILKYRLPGKIERHRDLMESGNSLGVKGLFTAAGETWKYERKLVSPALNHSHVTDYIKVFDACSKRLVSHWKSLRNIPDIGRDLSMVTADAIAKVAMDVDFDFLRTDKSTMYDDLNYLTTAFSFRGVSPIKYYKIPFIGQHLDGCSGPITRINNTIKNAINEQETTENQSNSFVQKLFSIMKAEKAQLQMDRMIGNVLTLFVAGTDTSAKTMIQALRHLALDTGLQKELQHEALANKRKIVDMDTGELFSGFPKIKSFLHEIHRHYGAPLILLDTLVDIPFCGTTLPKNSIIMVLLRHINRNEWAPCSGVPLGANGEKPHEFCPSRYLVEKDGKLTCPAPVTKNAAIGAFGAGVRICPGRAYAEALSLAMLVTLLREFGMELAANHPDSTDVQFNITVVPTVPINLVVTPRSD